MNKEETVILVPRSERPLKTKSSATANGAGVIAADLTPLVGSVPQGDRVAAQRAFRNGASESIHKPRTTLEQLTLFFTAGQEPSPDIAVKSTPLPSGYINIFSSISELAIFAYKGASEIVSSVIALFKPRSSVLTFNSGHSAQIPEQTSLIQLHKKDSSSLHGTHTIFDLATPKNSAPASLQTALELAATEARRARTEERAMTEKEAYHEHNLKVAVTRDKIHAIDARNGIKNSMAEEIINQLEGPFAISPESAIARIEELQRSEKS